jgi:hypothetical protein
MTVVNVFQAGWLTESGILEQPLEPLIVTICFLILHQQPDKLGMGELR